MPLLVFLTLVLLGSDPGAAAFAAPCGDEPGDAAAIADARAEVDATCDCAGAASHGAYVRCAAGIASDRVASGALRRECKKVVKRCASRSTCGKPGAVTCCRIDAKGVGRACTVKSDAAKCVPPRGGSACVGSSPSCCDACTVEGACASSSTTTTPSVTTTTTTLRPCVGVVILDPANTITTIPRGAALDVPAEVTSSTGGTFDIFLEDGGAGGQVACPPSGCSMGVILSPGGSTTVHFTYTASPSAPATITLTVHLAPHSVGFTCGPGSAGSTSSRTYPVSP